MPEPSSEAGTLADGVEPWTSSTESVTSSTVEPTHQASAIDDGESEQRQADDDETMPARAVLGLDVGRRR